ncbi:hypothetical protein CH281_18550 [Rhodococcus sp. 06-221-2]|nr:hypothetical protein [Rhodococcus fascians]NIL92714.1 hypothetical protein [Rhodococcus fascians]OZD00380.1 hypothetical protein CH281_18550 [Rhodococcus sp. 06-221-2]
MVPDTHGRERPGPSKGKLVRLALLAVLELCAAWLLAKGLIWLGKLYADNHFQQSVTLNQVTVVPNAGRVAHSHHTTSPSLITDTAMNQQPSVVGWVFLAVGCIAGIVVWMFVQRGRTTTRDGSLSLGCGLGVVVIAMLPAVRAATEASHAAMMIQLMMLMVIAPALIASVIRPRSNSRAIAQTRMVAIPSALGYAAVMVWWHLPLQSASGDTAWLAVAALLLGLIFWAGILSDDRPEDQRLQRISIYVAGLPAGLIGLALILSTEPILGVHDHSNSVLGSVTDQRLGGVLMMLVEGIFLIPLLLRASAPRERSQGSPS